MLNNPKEVRRVIAGKELVLKTGVMAKQANGAVTLECGKLILLATATMSKQPKEGIDFFPLTVEFSEKMYAAGKIPGGFFKREARPTVDATLVARLIDRPLRPSFPKGLYNEVQVVVTVLSYDDSISLEPYAIVAASAALTIADIPFNGPVGAALVGLKSEQLEVNPSVDFMKESKLDIVVSGTKDAILMVEAGANEVSEDTIIDSIELAHQSIKETVFLQEEFRDLAGKEKKAAPVEDSDHDLELVIKEFLGNKIEENMQSGQKQEIELFLTELQDAVNTQFVNEDQGNAALVSKIYNKLKKEQIRNVIIQKKVRPDGRQCDEIRPIEIELGVLPNVHGSSLFTRGETQSLGVVTLGTSEDSQMKDGLAEKTTKDYYFHYNFPPFSVGECGFIGRTGRRELGHGALAERALEAIIPKDFPYTIRIVSEIFESNGSSSMASVCSGSLSLMDCGVPTKAQVSGIAMGLLLDGDDYVILSDIQGLEDHYGDMDFKVAGTSEGITALQLDIKVAGLSKEILVKSLAQAKEGRLHILGEMNDALNAPRQDISPNAPKIQSISINPEKVGLVIGPGGKMIRSIEEESGATVVISDGSTGEVNISARNQEELDKAKNMILSLVKDVEIGDEYDGKVVKITTFGAFVELVPGKEGLMHISTLSDRRIGNVEDVVEVGQLVAVKVRDIDKQNRVSLVPKTKFE